MDRFSSDRKMQYAFEGEFWRTNDIVTAPDSMYNPRGQIFPIPIWEKNGSRDAFRYFTHEATGGSDHICFNNPSVAVPGIEMNVWPDQWYHADTDTVDKADPTQLKRTAFMGAACVLAAANCTDEILEPLLDAVNAFGYARVGKRELPKVFKYIDEAKANNLKQKVAAALNLAQFAVERERGAILSVRDICPGTERTLGKIQNRIRQWEFYGESLEDQILKYTAHRAKELGVQAPTKPKLTAEEQKYDKTIPSIHKGVRSQEFWLERSDRCKKYLETHPDALKKLKVSKRQQESIRNFINGQRSITKIRNCVMAETGADLSFEKLLGYLDFLKTLNWIEY